MKSTKGGELIGESNNREGVVSIVVPVYNAERFLKRCIDSVIQQTYINWELILVNDGSVDRSSAICTEYEKKESRIRVLHQKNMGVSVARNSGLRVCHGEFLYFLDADDYIAPETLHILIDIAKSKCADIVMHGHYRVEHNGQLVNNTNWEESTQTKEIQEDILLDKIPNFVCAKLYRRKLWDNIFFPQGQVMEDMIVIVKVFFKAKKIILSKIPLYYYSHENAHSITMGNSIFHYVRVRYGKFLAWASHAEIADKYSKHCESSCIKKAIQCGIRVYTLDYGLNALTYQEKLRIKSYINENKNYLARNIITILGYFAIVYENHLFLLMAGKLQRRIVIFQQKRRQRKIEN